MVLLSTLRLVVAQDAHKDPSAFLSTKHQPTNATAAADSLNLTTLLSTSAITADVLLLDRIKKNDLLFVDAARQFYIKHYPVGNFRTKDLAIGDSAMDDINSVRDFLINVTSRNADIDVSDCSFRGYAVKLCEGSDLSVPSFLSALWKEYHRAERCTAVISRIQERREVLSQVQRPWESSPQSQASCFWRDLDLQWFIPHTNRISAQENLI